MKIHVGSEYTANAQEDELEDAQEDELEDAQETPYVVPQHPHCPLNHVLITENNEQEGTIRKLIVGMPLRTEETNQLEVSKWQGIGFFASTALSSLAFATEEIFHVLALAGIAALALSTPVAIAICVLLVIITLSYRQIMFAYPEGGGAYTVVRDNLGVRVAQVTGAALLADYVLTLAVSISASVEQLVSLFPTLLPYRVLIGELLIVTLTLINLRGVRASTNFFVIPTYVFIGMTLLLLGVGGWRWYQGTLPTTTGVALHVEAIQPLTIFLILRAFSSGSTALTGMKTFSIAITSFKKPRSRNVSLAMDITAGMMIVLFLGITMLAFQVGAVPNGNETMFSQLARTVFDANSIYYWVMIGATMSVLLLAANTSYARFPRLAALQADDGFLPHQFALRGHRLVFWWGIVVLALSSALLLLLFDGRTTVLIPLYAIGVFLSFTLSQAGMLVRWRAISRLRPGDTIQRIHSTLSYTPHWRFGIVVNALGCGVTALMTLVFVVSKFNQGAWIILLIMGGTIWLFFNIKHHYVTVARSLSLERYTQKPPIATANHTVVILVSGVHRGTLDAARYALTLQAHKIIAVHVETDPDNTLKVYERWHNWMPHIPLIVVDSPYRTLFRPLVRYVNNLSSG